MKEKGGFTLLVQSLCFHQLYSS